MEGDCFFRSKRLVGFDGIGWSHVDVAHEAARFVCSRGKEGDIGRAEAFADVGKVFCPCGVSAEVEADAGVVLDEVSAPEGFVF